MKQLSLLLVLVVSGTWALGQASLAKLVLRGEPNVIPARLMSCSDGGYLMSGSANPSGGPTKRDLLIARFDHSFNLIWRKVLGTTKDENASALMETSTHDIVVAYSTCDSMPVPNGNFSAMHILKLDASGNTRWIKSFFQNKFCSTNPIRSIFEAPGGNYVIFHDPSVLTFGEPVGVFVTDTAGNIVSDKQIRNSSSIDFPIAVRYGSNFIIGGTDDLIAINKNSLMYVFCDAAGTVRHSGRYGHVSDDLTIFGLSPTPDGHVLLLSGVAGSGSSMVKIDTSGNLKWAKNYSSNGDTSFSVALMGNNRMFLIGYCYIGGHANANINVLAAEIDTAGNFLWAKTAPVPCGVINAVYDGSDNSVVLTSYYYLPPYTTLLMRLALSPTLSCGEQTIVVRNRPYGIILNVTGTVNDTVSTYPVPVPALSIGGSASVADSLLCGTPAAVVQISNTPGFTIYPNPLYAGAGLRVVTKIFGADTKLELLDISGRLLYRKTLLEAMTTLEDLRLPGGLYYARLTQGGIVATQKLLVEN